MLEVRGVEELEKLSGVSRETLQPLQEFVSLLLTWQKRINLISGKTADDIWHRHIWDSAQLLSQLPTGRPLSILDMGAGAGFPSMVLAPLTAHKFTLVESDSRKCAFLREAARVLNIADRVEIKNCRIEALESQAFDVITCRAFAPLVRLLDYGFPFAHQRTEWILLKGQGVEEELTQAQLYWTMTCEQFQSRSSTSGRILKIRGVDGASSR